MRLRNCCSNCGTPIVEDDRLSMDEMREELRRQVAAAGGIIAWLKANNAEITHKGAAHQALAGVRPVGPEVAVAAGYIRICEPVTFSKWKV